jgi:hypothetical protein
VGIFDWFRPEKYFGNTGADAGGGTQAEANAKAPATSYISHSEPTYEPSSEPTDPHSHLAQLVIDYLEPRHTTWGRYMEVIGVVWPAVTYTIQTKIFSIMIGPESTTLISFTEPPFSVDFKNSEAKQLFDWADTKYQSWKTSEVIKSRLALTILLSNTVKGEETAATVKASVKRFKTWAESNAPRKPEPKTPTVRNPKRKPSTKPSTKKG